MYYKVVDGPSYIVSTSTNRMLSILKRSLKFWLSMFTTKFNDIYILQAFQVAYVI